MHDGGEGNGSSGQRNRDTSRLEREEGRRVHLFNLNSLGALWSDRGQTNGCLLLVHADRNTVFVAVRVRSYTIVQTWTKHAITEPPGESVQGFRNEPPIPITFATRNRSASLRSARYRIDPGTDFSWQKFRRSRIFFYFSGFSNG